MIDLKPVNILMTIGEIRKPELLPQTSINLWGKQIRVYSLYKAHWNLAKTSDVSLRINEF